MDNSDIKTPNVFDLAHELVSIPSESFQEQEIVAYLENRLSAVPWLETTRIGDNLIAQSHGAKDLRVLLGGHTDTVPPQGNAQAKVVDDVLWGVGSADMKGGVAVMLSLAETLSETAVDVSYVFYAREEVAHENNGLLEIDSQRPELLNADLAILGEPTSGNIEAGCQGTMRFVLELTGERAHTARPWMGRNAIHRLHGVLRAIDEYEPRKPMLEGCEYCEAIQVVKVNGGVAGNVIPDLSTLTINHRVAPDRDLLRAETEIRSFLEPYMEEGDQLTLVDAAPPAKPGLSNPMLASMIRNHDLEVKAKLGWTDVAFFDQRNIPAVNFGPGDASLAHTKNERVERTSIEGCFEALKQMITLGV
ncbi:MAG: succinyl-diaminopimelate desuccinylase [Acidimicrobiales bacterium]|jgi:succinyl-diaminopimelate desuccinylase|nr:succinyl-diaminopimelate desuccinylase [Acidimicrobiales bacterium]MDP6298522.1 succinyl-diaminopimelate desuccinylase [Acidimicrobiales bacterium]HJM27592.1 succinyl-diaminopimelate desuccinylase [Acidimicrobiales bacterium]